MSSAEALTVTALGIAVVFTGLLLCFGCMAVLARLSAWVTLGEPHGPAQAAPPLPAPAAAPIPDEVLAVIVAVLEVERALYVGRYRSRLTLRRPAPSTGDVP
jgi:Na+-transporting methylmalonyl-CoA/oxaloacetate decarboxylase gamma subunit